MAFLTKCVCYWCPHFVSKLIGFIITHSYSVASSTETEGSWVEFNSVELITTYL